MERNKWMFVLLITLGLISFSCKRENTVLKKEAEEIAAVMCENIGLMTQMHCTDPTDTVTVNQLQAEYKEVLAKLKVLYGKLEGKYGKKFSDKAFAREFRKYLNASMLGCKLLKPEERALFEKDISE
jgi:hypothetical protein